MAKVNFKRTLTDTDVSKIPVEDGNFILTGSGTAYMDYEDERIKISGGGSSSDDTPNITVDSSLSSESENPVQNKVIKNKLDAIEQSLDTVLNATNNITNNIASAYIVGDTDESEIVFDNLDMLGDGGHYHLEMQIVTSTQEDFAIYINNNDGGYYHMALAFQSTSEHTGNVNMGSQYYENNSNIGYWFHGCTLDFFPSKLIIDLSFNTLNDGKKLVNYSIKYINAQSANNQFSIVNGQHYNFVDNLTSLKIKATGSMKFVRGTSGTIYKSRY